MGTIFAKAREPMLWLLVLIVVSTVVFTVLQPLVWDLLDRDLPTTTLDITTLATLMALVVALLSIGIGAFGIIVYRLMEGTLERALGSGWQIATMQLHETVAHSFWLLYQAQEPLGKGEALPADVVPAVDAAIVAAQSALRAAQVLSPDEPMRERYILRTTNSLAYHLSSRANTDDERPAGKLAASVLRAAAKYDSNPHWRETSVWYYWRYGATASNTERALRILLELLDDRSVAPETQDRWRGKYENLLALASDDQSRSKGSGSECWNILRGLIGFFKKDA